MLRSILLLKLSMICLNTSQDALQRKLGQETKHIIVFVGHLIVQELRTLRSHIGVVARLQFLFVTNCHPPQEPTESKFYDRGDRRVRTAWTTVQRRDDRCETFLCRNDCHLSIVCPAKDGIAQVHIMLDHLHPALEDCQKRVFMIAITRPS